MPHAQVQWVLTLGQTCFRDEPGAISEPLRDDDGWNTEYASYHSPVWWQALFLRGGRFDVDHCAEIPDGDIFWEDHALYCGDRAGWSEDFMTQHGWVIRHIDRSRTSEPHLTHFMLSAVKSGP